MLWEMFSNARLFAGSSDIETMHRVRDCRVPNVQTLNADVPDQAAAIVRKALLADKALRFQSASDFIKTLEVLARRNGWPVTVDALKPLLGG